MNKKQKIISILDEATTEIARLLSGGKLEMEEEDCLCQQQQALQELKYKLEIGLLTLVLLIMSAMGPAIDSAIDLVT